MADKPSIKCEACGAPQTEDTVVWADPSGTIHEGHFLYNTIAWCETCLPAQ